MQVNFWKLLIENLVEISSIAEYIQRDACNFYSLFNNESRSGVVDEDGHSIQRWLNFFTTAATVGHSASWFILVLVRAGQFSSLQPSYYASMLHRFLSTRTHKVPSAEYPSRKHQSGVRNRSNRRMFQIDLCICLSQSAAMFALSSVWVRLCLVESPLQQRTWR